MSPLVKQFDPDLALDQAMRVFWAKGYDGTSLADLLEAMGIHKGSFYDTFGSKHALYLRAVDRYADQRSAQFDRLTEGQSPRQAILTIFDAISKECVGDGRDMGCFSINCAIEMAPSDPESRRRVQQNFRFHENMLARIIQRGQAQGEVPRSIDPKAAAKVLLGLTMAMRVYSKAGAPRSTFEALRRQVESVLTHGP